MADKTKMVEELVKQMLTKEFPTDCTFIVPDDVGDAVVKIRCHKAILAAASEVFQAMFCSGFNESKDSIENEIHLTDTNASAFKEFIEYIYYQNTHPLKYIGLKNLLNLCYLCEKYMIKDLTQKCVDVIKSAITSYADNEVIEIFEVAHTINHQELLQQCSQTIKKRSKSIGQVVTNGLPLKVFYELLKELKGSVTEEVRFTFVENYISANKLHKINEEATDRKESEKGKDVVAEVVKSNSEETTTSENDAQDGVKDVSTKTVDYGCKNLGLYALLKCIDYYAMTLTGFINGPARSEYLTLQERYNILLELCKGKNHSNVNQRTRQIMY